ncbi:MAG: VTT domain-containing protein [Lachnospiraceae bacterium]|nr:VTT domain-containing protein [Lachnospiraceae bacterium]
MKEKIKNSKWFRIAVVVVVVAFLVWLTVELFGPMLPEIIKYMKADDEAAMAAYLKEQGEWRGLISIFLLSIIQVISVVFPGIVIQFTSGMIYSWWKAFIFSYAGFVMGNALVFIFARTFRQGMKLNKKKSGWIISTINKYNPAFVFSLACLVPGVPNGSIPYAAAASAVTGREYVIGVAVSSWIQILSNCIAGHFLMKKQPLFMVISFAAQIAIILIIGFNRKRILTRFGQPLKKGEDAAVTPEPEEE